MFSVFKKLSWFFKMEWKRYTVAILLLGIAGIMDIIPPWLMGRLIDAMGQGMLGTEEFYWSAIFWVGIIIVGYIMTYIWHYQLFGGAFVLERLLRSRLMRHFLRMRPTFYERNRTGDLMARATNDLGAVATTAGFGILTLVDSTLFMITILIMMAGAISLKLTLAALLPLPIMALAMSYYGKKFMNATSRRSKHSAN